MQHECPHCGGKIETKAIRREIRGENWRILEGDALAIMRDMDAESIDGVITDPPYGSGAYTAADRMTKSTAKYASGEGGKGFPEIACDSIPPEAWQTLMRDTLHETARLLREGGVFAFFIDWRGIGQLSSFAAIAGLRPRGVAVWHKTGGVRPYKGGIAQSAEFILWGTKGKIIQRDVYIKGVLHAPNIPMARRRHLTEKPVDVMRELMPLVPGDVVLDPFAGSASTGEAAILCGKRFIGIETVPDYVDVAEARLRAIEKQRRNELPL